MKTLTAIPELNARELYKTAYRNARCVRNLDPRATLTHIAYKFPLQNRYLITEIVAYAIQHLEDRRDPMMGWFCIPYENAFNLRKRQINQ